MAGHTDASGKYVKGIEDELTPAQYRREAHQTKVVEDIADNGMMLSQNNTFHALFATSSIPEAIDYYRALKKAKPTLNITALFDPNIDNLGDQGRGVLFKQQGLVEIMDDYNQHYQQDFSLATHDQFKKDIAARLAHKKPYLRIEKTPEQHIHLLIVVDQMLTGFDSKWLNTLYLDKLLRYEHIIQAFSRTNRLFGPDKPFGTIRYYRYPHTMERNINDAVKLYSGDKPIGLFVDQLESNLKKLNTLYDEIAALFENAGVANIEKLPDDASVQGKFAKCFKHFNGHLEAAKIQGFSFDEIKSKSKTKLQVDEKTYLTLVLRYKELSSGREGGGSDGDVPFEIDGYLTEIDTGKIDADYMNTRFDKYLKTLKQEGADGKHVQKTLDELHKSFASLTQEEQKYANIFIHDIQRGEVNFGDGENFRERITEYQCKAKNAQISLVSQRLGLDVNKLNSLMNTEITAANINEFGRFDELKNTVDKQKAKAYFEKLEGSGLSIFKVNIKIDQLLQDFIINGGFELEGSLC
jgi:type I restriction enzyme R subunit